MLVCFKWRQSYISIIHTWVDMYNVQYCTAFKVSIMIGGCEFKW